MSNKMDKLFKDKLESHALQPSAQAWEKVEAHLGKKNKMVLWLRVAAAVVLLGVLTFVGLSWNEEPKQELVKKESGVRSQNPEVRSPEPEVKQPERDEKTESIEPKKKEIKKQKVQPKAEDPAPSTQNPEPIEQLAVVEEPAVVIQQPVTNNQQPITNNRQPVTNNQQPKRGITITYSLPQKEKSITLTYSLPPIGKGEPAVATVEEPRKTGLNRVLEIAMEVKNGDPLGELREAKNDIFALDFRKDKSKKH